MWVRFLYLYTFIAVALHQESLSFSDKENKTEVLIKIRRLLPEIWRY